LKQACGLHLGWCGRSPRIQGAKVISKLDFSAKKRRIDKMWLTDDGELKAGQ
jgi:hypothetical protein